MSRYIDADKIHYINNTDVTTRRNIDMTPTEDVVEIKRGWWKYLALEPDDITGHTHGECSICGKRRIVDNYCPNCGAKMDEVEE